MAITINGTVKPEYTMFYKDFVEDYGMPQALNRIPTVTIGDETYNFATMFYDRNKWREIGAETPEYWRHIADRYLDEVSLIFNVKIKGWEAALGDLWKRETKSEESTTDNYYYNPTVAANGNDNPKLQSTSQHIYPHHIVYNTDTAADMINGALDVRNIYYECLEYCDKLFITLY